MKRNVKKITEAILAGKDIRKSLSEDADLELEEILDKESIDSVEDLIKVGKEIGENDCLINSYYDEYGFYNEGGCDVSSFEELADGFTAEISGIPLTNENAAYLEPSYRTLKVQLKGDKITVTLSGKNGFTKTCEKTISGLGELFDEVSSVLWDDLDALVSEDDEDIDESLKESFTPDSKDIARAEKLKTQNPKFAAKMSRSIKDAVKWERRYQAIKNVCGDDSEQAKAFAAEKPSFSQKRLEEKDIEEIVKRVQRTSKYGKYYKVYVDGPDWSWYDADPDEGLPSFKLSFVRNDSMPLPDVDEDYGEEFDNGGNPESLEDLEADISNELMKHNVDFLIWDGTDGVSSNYVYEITA